MRLSGRSQRLEISIEQLNSCSQLSGSQGEIRINCLFCQDESHHCYVNLSKGVFHCFKCEARGKVNTGNKLWGNLDSFRTKIVDAITVQKTKIVKSLPRSESLLEVSSDQSEFYLNDTYNRYYKYLVSTRGLTPREIIQNDIQVSLDRSGIYSDSVIFPMYESGDLSYFVCRKLSGDTKYVNAPWPKAGTFFTPKNQPETPYTVLCEGIFDALRISRVAHAKAILGKQLTEQQLALAVNISVTRPVLILLDKDAWKYSVMMATEIKARGGKAYICNSLQLNGDPGDTDLVTLKEIFQECVSFNQLSRR